MTTDTLTCRCGGEVKVVRLNPETLTFGHVRNPRQNRHAVRLSRSATASLGAVDESLNEVADTGRCEDVPNAVASTRMSNGTRPATNGLDPEPHRRKSASGIASQPPEQGASQTVIPPTQAPRSALAAGRR